ncbi:MAG: Thivi_2564 family membrane protein [Micropepsaceae bacterium]
MPLIQLVIALVIVGVLLWAVNTYIPMDGKIKNILNIVVVAAVVIWLLQVFGILSGLGTVHVGV